MPLDWSPPEYLHFAGERAQPLLDLVARVGAVDPAVLVDLRCGTGELTASLAARWPGARVTGVDSSPAMLAAAARETTYLHALTGLDPVLGWVRGSVLRPVLDRLGAEAAAFEADYGAALRIAYPARPGGTTLLPFRREFAVGQRGTSR